MSTGQKKILVADDSLTIRKLVETVLSQEGYEVVTAETGADCLALAAAQKPSLILLDYILPDKQGTEICRQLINSPETWEIPVLMMSSNGNAIRQLYQDLNNVADYLTKPFAPNVLKAVVGHLLREDTEDGAAATNGGAAAPAGNETPAMPEGLMDKVTRLLDLIETNPAVAKTEGPAAQAEPAAAGAPAKAKAKPRRARKAVATAPAPEALTRKFRLAIQKHLRSRMHQIPDWETNRGTAEPEAYFLNRLLSKDLLADLSATLVRAAGLPAGGAGALRAPVALVPLDGILRHLEAGRATGELQLETRDETVLCCLDGGKVALITTNHPRNYCAGAACDFSAVPHTAIGEAVRAQEEQSVPFFISLEEQGYLPPGADLPGLLQAQGQKCLSRVFAATDAVVSFYPLTRLPAMVRGHKTSVPLNQLLLVCYRTVDDWFTLEKAFPDMEAILGPTAELDSLAGDLTLHDQETVLLAVTRSGRTIAELVDLTGLKQFEVCRLLYRFLRLGLIRPGARRTCDERVDDEPRKAAMTPAPVPPEVPHLLPAQPQGEASPEADLQVPAVAAEPGAPAPEVAPGPAAAGVEPPGAALTPEAGGPGVSLDSPEGAATASVAKGASISCTYCN